MRHNRSVNILACLGKKKKSYVKVSAYDHTVNLMMMTESKLSPARSPQLFLRPPEVKKQ